MRRKQCEITDPQEIQRILDATPIGRMASIGLDGYPYITPVNFVYYQGCIYFHCAPKGEKLQNIERDPKVCSGRRFGCSTMATIKMCSNDRKKAQSVNVN
jgi:hypothetical protein